MYTKLKWLLDKKQRTEPALLLSYACMAMATNTHTLTGPQQ